MASYDPQARRSRPPPSEQRPVDDLLGPAGAPAGRRAATTAGG